ncbi:MAG: tetratricopeptide repeat protein [Vicinamibacterales bacterium]
MARSEVASPFTAHPLRSWPAGIFACALAAGLIHLGALQSAPWSHVLLGDGLSYDRWAREIASGDWLGRDVFYQAPLYPYLLGALYWIAGPDVLAVRLLQVLLGAVAAVLLGLATARLFGRRAGIVAGLMLGLYPPVVFSDGLVQKSALDILLVCTAAWLMAPLIADRDAATAAPSGAGARGAVRWLSLGLALGALMLTRENAAVLLAAVVAWALIDASLAGPRAWRAGLVVAGAALVLAPVAVRNALVGGEFHLTTSQFGPNFYIGNHAGANGTYTSLRPRRGNATYERQDAVDMAEAAAGRTVTPAEVSSYFTTRALEDIRADPRGWLALLGRKTALLWNAVEIADSDDQYTAAEWSPLLRVTGTVWHMGVLAPLAVLGVVVTWPRRWTLWPLYLLIATYASSVVLFYVFARYRLPLVPLLVVFAAPGLVEAPRHWRTARGPARAAVAGLVVAVAVFCNWPLLRPDDMRATMHFNLGVVQMQADRPAEAADEFRLAATLRPAFAEAHNNLGIVLGELARLDEASAAFDRAIAADPGFARALTNSGEVLQRLGRHDLARERFERAAAADSQSTRALSALGRAYASSGQLDRAEAAFRKVLAIAPDSAGAYNDLAALLGRQGRLEEAAVQSRRALELDPRNVEAENNLAAVAASAGRLEEAATRLTRALALDPDRAQTHYNLGAVRAQQGRLDEARAEFERTLALDAGHAQAARALEALARQPATGARR